MPNDRCVRLHGRVPPPMRTESFAEELKAALLKAEGVVNPGPTHTKHTGAYIHRFASATSHRRRRAPPRTAASKS